MQVGTYPTRNFATFGPSVLQPPFTVGYSRYKCNKNLTKQHWAGVSPYTFSFELAETCVFIKQSLLLNFLKTFIKSYSLFRSYRANLPSSFNIITLNALVYFIPIYLCWFAVRSFDILLFPEKLIKR